MCERSEYISRVTRVLAAILLSTAWYGSVVAQTAKPDPLRADKHAADEMTPFASLAEEMRAKRAIKFADKEHQDNLDRARNLAFLGITINAAFTRKNFLDAEDLKRLDKAEKFAKGIRRAAGGSEDKIEIEKPPKNLSSSLSMFEELSQSLKEKVEKTPKHVVSAAVIDEANVLLEVIRTIRSFHP